MCFEFLFIPDRNAGEMSEAEALILRPWILKVNIKERECPPQLSLYDRKKTKQNTMKHMSTEKHSHNLKVESYFIWWECLGLWAHETAISEKISPRRQEGKSGYMQVCNKGIRLSEHQRSGIKLRNLSFYVWEYASLLSHWIHSFPMHLNYWANPISLFTLLLYSPSSPTLGGDSIPWVSVLVALIHIWRPGITDGCDISCLLIWQDIFSSHTYYSITLCAKSLQSCLTLCDYMNHSLPDSSVYGSLQARILEWVVIPFSRGSSWPRDQTLVSYVSCIGRQVLYL